MIFRSLYHLHPSFDKPFKIILWLLVYITQNSDQFICRSPLRGTGGLTTHPTFVCPTSADDAEPLAVRIQKLGVGGAAVVSLLFYCG